MVVTLLLVAAVVGRAVATDSVDTNIIGMNAPAQCLIVRDTAAAQDLKIEQFGRNAVRVRIVPTGQPFRDDLVSALIPPMDGFSATAGCNTVDLTAAGQAVTSGNLQAAVGSDGLLTFTRLSDQRLLLAEAARSLAPTVTTPKRGGFLSFNISFKAAEGERIYGLGQHKTGLLDNAGLQFNLAPHNTEILIPVAHSSRGYAFLMNLPSFGSVEFGTPQKAPPSCPANETKPCPGHPGRTYCQAVADAHQCSATGLTSWQLDTVLQGDFWVATTSAPDLNIFKPQISPWAQLQHSYANATGHAPVYPEWASGFWQCKNRYHNQTQILDVVRGYIQRGYPISLIIIDYFNWNPDPLGDETLPAQCWPDPQGMVNELKQLGVELMISPCRFWLTSLKFTFCCAC